MFTRFLRSVRFVKAGAQSDSTNNMEIFKLFFSTVLWLVIFGNLNAMSVQTLYQKLKELSVEDIEWYLRLSLYVAREKNNLFDIDVGIPESCIQIADGYKPWEFKKIGKSEISMYKKWHSLKLCSTQVANTIQNSHADILKNPAELVCECLATPSESSQGFLDQKPEMFYFDELPGSRRDAMNTLIEKLDSEDLIQTLFLEIFCNSSEVDSVYHDLELYTLFKMIESIHTQSFQVAQMFNEALEDSTYDLNMGTSIAKKIYGNASVMCIIEQMTKILKKNLWVHIRSADFGAWFIKRANNVAEILRNWNPNANSGNVPTANIADETSENIFQNIVDFQSLPKRNRDI